MADQDWRQLAEAARNEEDPDKLMQLIEDLNRMLGKSGNLGPVNPDRLNPDPRNRACDEAAS
jgi:hypothetical protein